MEKIRNIAIIAHVDHGKTTLVDQLLRQSGTFRSNQAVVERVMDSMDLEREKGITIKAKNAAFQYQDYHINIVDTPGHADFGGEVERILKMVDGVLLVVDAFDGPQAQTKFVLSKALEVGAKPIVVINKIDRENARPHKVLDMVFELFLELNATDEQLDFTVIYASAKLGFAGKEWKGHLDDETRNAGMTALYEAIIEQIPPPDRQSRQALRDARLQSRLQRLHRPDRLRQDHRRQASRSATRSSASTRTAARKRAPSPRSCPTPAWPRSRSTRPAPATSSASPASRTSTSARPSTDSGGPPAPLPFVDIDPPTIKMQFVVNDSPLAGREGKFLTARHIRDRLVRETRTNVSIISRRHRHGRRTSRSAPAAKCRSPSSSSRCAAKVSRSWSPAPRSSSTRTTQGNVLEPIETLYVETPADKLGDILQGLANRKGEIVNMKHHHDHRVGRGDHPHARPDRLRDRPRQPHPRRRHHEPSLQGVRPEARRNHHPPERRARLHGIAATRPASPSTTSRNAASLFISPGEAIYAGMVVGENSRPDDMAVNPCKAKALTNMRSQGDGKGIQLDTPIKMSLERALEYIGPDEFVEATPTSLRLRKKILDENKRRRAESKA